MRTADIFDAEYEGPVTTKEADPYDLSDLDIEQTGLAKIPYAPATANDYTSFLEIAERGQPRDIKKMLDEAKRVGSLMGKDAFYRFPMGRSQIEGPSIKLAYALAQVWGRNVTRCQVTASEGNRVYLRGVFVDLLTVAITERDFVATLAPAPGKFANKPDQAERWRTMQEQSAISKAVRGAILGGLPAWFIQAAMVSAIATADEQARGGKPLPEARKAAIDHFAKVHKLTADDLAVYLGMPSELWASPQVGELRELAEQLKSGAVAIEAVRAEIARQRGGEQKPTGADALLGKRARDDGGKPPPKTDPPPSDPPPPPPDPEPNRADCAVCGKNLTVTKSGGLYQHKGEDGQDCPGSGQAPGWQPEPATTPEPDPHTPPAEWLALQKDCLVAMEILGIDKAMDIAGTLALDEKLAVDANLGRFAIEDLRRFKASLKNAVDHQALDDGQIRSVCLELESKLDAHGKSQARIKAKVHVTRAIDATWSDEDLAAYHQALVEVTS